MEKKELGFKSFIWTSDFYHTFTFFGGGGGHIVLSVIDWTSIFLVIKSSFLNLNVMFWCLELLLFKIRLRKIAGRLCQPPPLPLPNETKGKSDSLCLVTTTADRCAARTLSTTLTTTTTTTCPLRKTPHTLLCIFRSKAPLCTCWSLTQSGL